MRLLVDLVTRSRVLASGAGLASSFKAKVRPSQAQRPFKPAPGGQLDIRSCFLLIIRNVNIGDCL